MSSVAKVREGIAGGGGGATGVGEEAAGVKKRATTGQGGNHSHALE